MVLIVVDSILPFSIIIKIWLILMRLLNAVSLMICDLYTFYSTIWILIMIWSELYFNSIWSDLCFVRFPIVILKNYRAFFFFNHYLPQKYKQGIKKNQYSCWRIVFAKLQVGIVATEDSTTNIVVSIVFGVQVWCKMIIIVISLSRIIAIENLEKNKEIEIVKLLKTLKL